MNENLYFNELGFEDYLNNEGHRKRSESYYERIRHETIRVAVIVMLKSNSCDATGLIGANGSIFQNQY